MRALVAVLLLAPAVASADDVGTKLGRYEVDARRLATDMPKLGELGGPHGSHTLTEAELAFSLGDYDTASRELFDLVRSLQGPERDSAIYYLAESKYQKGDRGAARMYFTQLASANNVSSKWYQPALIRLVEIAIAQEDNTHVDEWLGDLDRVSGGLRLPQVPYVHGKYSFSQGKYDEALAYFNQVPKGSDFELEALYYTAVTSVAKKDLAKATDIFTDLIGRQPRTSNDRRMIELGQLALGRLYYERDQPSKSIDSYLLIDRHSDLFPDALYEVGWVYVKNKQYDHALRALELLEQSDPDTTKTPTVRILEGNLRIRKAQMIRAGQVNGTAGPSAPSDPEVEYAKASEIFAQTHAEYLPSYLALKDIVEGHADPTSFLVQISGRSGHAFQATTPIPEAAVQWMRDEPAVQRFVTMETELGDLQDTIGQTKQTISLLEAMVVAPDKVSVFPALASRRAEISRIQNDLIGMRSQLADDELKLVDQSGQVGQVAAARQALEKQYAALGDPDKAFADRVVQIQQGYDGLDTALTEVESALDSTQAMSVAMRKYMMDKPDAIAADAKAATTQQLDATGSEAQAIEDEIVELRHEIELGKDLATISDDQLVQARAVRTQLIAALGAEHRVLAGFASASHDPSKSQALAALGSRATVLAEGLEQSDGQLEQLAQAGIASATTELAAERTVLSQLQQDLATQEADAKAVGTTVLAASLKDVEAKLADVNIRTDVGSVDVAWSQKEDTDDDLKRLNLARAREIKQLRDEFKDILDATAKPVAAKKTTSIPPPTDTTTGNPDQAGSKGGGDRIKPVDGGDKTGTSPTVKPDDPKKKAGGSK